MAMLDVNDPGNTYSVGYMWGTTGIGYDARKVAAALPDAPTESWRLVFDPEVASKLAGCGIAFVDAPSEIIAVALMSLGKDPYSSDAADLAGPRSAGPMSWRFPAMRHTRTRRAPSSISCCGRRRCPASRIRALRDLQPRRSATAVTPIGPGR